MSRRPRWWAIGRILVLALILHGVFLGYPFVRLGQWLGLEGLPDVDSVPQPSIQVRFVQLSINSIEFGLVKGDWWGFIRLNVCVRNSLLRKKSERRLAVVFRCHSAEAGGSQV